MRMTSFDEKLDSLLKDFEGFTREQQSKLLKSILLKCQPLQLRFLYSELKPLLSVDFVKNLPKEVTERIFSYLSVVTLCKVALCNSLWRERANHNPTWHTLCVQKGWGKFGEEQPLSLESSTVTTRPTSPSKVPPLPTFHFTDKESVLNPKTCRWKTIYIRAFYLQQNWKCGRYTIAPILRGHKEPVNAIDCDGKVLVSGGSDNSVRIWDLKEHRCSHVLDTPHSDSVRCVKLKDSLCISGCSDGVIRIFDVKKGQCLRSLQGYSGGIEHLCFDGKIIVSAASDRTVRVWNVNTGKMLHTLTGHTDDILFMSMRGVHVITTSWDETIRLWDIESGICVLTLRGHSEAVYCCQFDDRRIVSGGGDNLVIIWNASTADMEAKLTGHTGEVYSLVYSEQVIASGSSDSTVRLWSLEGLLLHTLYEHIGVVRCLSMKEDMLVSGGDRKKIVVWDTKTGSLLNVVHRNPSLLHVMWTDETKLITASPEKPGTITIINYW